MSSTTTGIFNVQEAQGTDRVQYETTAAAAQAEAPTSGVAREVEQNAEHEKYAAQQAAHAAQNIGLGGETRSTSAAAEQLKQQKDAAVLEGQRDVEAAKEQGATYLEQAQNVAANVATTVQSYLPEQSTVTSEVQAGAAAAIGTTKEYLAAAQQTAQPHIERAVDAATKYMSGDKADQETTPASSTGIPPTNV